MEQKRGVHYVKTEKVVLTTESPSEICVWRFRSKQAVVRHKSVYQDHADRSVHSNNITTIPPSRDSIKTPPPPFKGAIILCTLPL